MKRILFSLLLIGIATVQAQNKLPFLIRGDFGLSNVKTSSGKGTSIFVPGIGIETMAKLVPVGESGALIINPNLTYLHTGYQTSSGGDVKVNYLSLGLPIMFEVNGLKSKEVLGLMFGAGPFINIAASGKFRNLSVDDYKSISFGNTTADNRTSTDAGLVLKSAIRIQKIYIGTQYNIGVSNVVPKDRISNGSYIKTRNFLFYISYALNKKK
jgi:hypothetical protein